MGCGASRRGTAALGGSNGAEAAAEAADGVPAVSSRVGGSAAKVSLATSPERWLADVGLCAPESEPVLQCCRQLGVRRLADLEWVSSEELAQMRGTLRLVVPQRKFDRAVRGLAAEQPDLTCLQAVCGSDDDAGQMKPAPAVTSPSKGAATAGTVSAGLPNSPAAPYGASLGHFGPAEQQFLSLWGQPQVAQLPWLRPPQWPPRYAQPGYHAALYSGSGLPLLGSATGLPPPTPPMFPALHRAPLTPLPVGATNSSVAGTSAVPPWFGGGSHPVATPQSDAAVMPRHRQDDAASSASPAGGRGPTASDDLRDRADAGLYRHLQHQKHRRPLSASAVPVRAAAAERLAPPPGASSSAAATHSRRSGGTNAMRAATRSHRPRTADVVHRQT
jgi:hypothetical protein